MMQSRSFDQIEEWKHITDIAKEVKTRKWSDYVSLERRDGCYSRVLLDLGLAMRDPTTAAQTRSLGFPNDIFAHALREVYLSVMARRVSGMRFLTGMCLLLTADFIWGCLSLYTSVSAAFSVPHERHLFGCTLTFCFIQWIVLTFGYSKPVFVVYCCFSCLTVYLMGFCCCRSWRRMPFARHPSKTPHQAKAEVHAFGIEIRYLRLYVLYTGRSFDGDGQWRRRCDRK